MSKFRPIYLEFPNRSAIFLASGSVQQNDRFLTVLTPFFFWSTFPQRRPPKRQFVAQETQNQNSLAFLGQSGQPTQLSKNDEPRRAPAGEGQPLPRGDSGITRRAPRDSRAAIAGPAAVRGRTTFLAGGRCGAASPIKRYGSNLSESGRAGKQKVYIFIMIRTDP